MFISIPIPIATEWVATARGTFWKVVSCSHCQQRYAFPLELETTGTDVGSPLSLDIEGASRAQARAEENLSTLARNVVLPVPCPNCGCYQPDMVDRLREEGTSNTPVIVGLIVAVLSLIPLAFRVPYIWVATAAGVSVGLGLIGYADWAGARWDPNAGDPEPRKVRGRKRAVWGEQLDRLLVTDLGAGPSSTAHEVGGQAADAEPGATADRGGST